MPFELPPQRSFAPADVNRRAARLARGERLLPFYGWENAPVYDKILREMRARVRRGNLVMTPHARREMFRDRLLLVDIERCILTGSIVERQWDDEFAEYKYLIEGETTEPAEFIHVAAKLGRHNTVIITVYTIL